MNLEFFALNEGLNIYNGKWAATVCVLKIVGAFFTTMTIFNTFVYIYVQLREEEERSSIANLKRQRMV